MSIYSKELATVLNNKQILTSISMTASLKGLCIPIFANNV